MVVHKDFTKVITNQRVSIAQKEKPEWYIENADSIISYVVSNNDKSKTKKFLDAANGIIDEDTYKYVIKNYESILGSKGILYGEMRDVDFLTPIKERYMGEFINMFYNYQVCNNDPSIVLKRNKEKAKIIMDWINQSIINELNNKDFPTNNPSQELPDIEKLIDDKLNDWMDDVVIRGQNRLELINTITEAKRVYQEAYYYWWTCEETYTYREIHNDDVSLQCISPLEYYRLDSGNRYVEDDDAGVRIYKMTIPQIIDRFRDELKDSEIKALEGIMTSASDGYISGVEFIKNLSDFAERKKSFGTTHSDIEAEYKSCNGSLDIYHYVWKTQIKIGILHHFNAINEITESIVDETYKFDKTKGDISIEHEWINQSWGGFRIGGKHSGIYIKPKPIDVQRENINNVSKCKLPYNGIVGLISDNHRNPIPYRILPYLTLYRIYTLQQERSIAKYKSWIIFPESLTSDSTKMTTEERIAAAVKDGTYFIDDADISQNAVNSIRQVSTDALLNYIKLLDDLKRQLKEDAWELANMNNARFGNTKDYGGKAVNEYNFSQALTGSVWSLECFNSFRERDYLANLDYSKVAWIDGKQGSYINPNTNEVEIVDIDGTSDFSDNIGINIRNNNDVQNVLKQMQDIAFAASQNGDFDLAMNAIQSKNIKQISKNIKDAVEAKRQFELQVQKVQEEARAQTEHIISEREIGKQQYESEQNQLDRDNEVVITQMKIESEERIVEAKLKIDVNGNGYLDKDELAARDGGYTKSDIELVKMKKALKE